MSSRRDYGSQSQGFVLVAGQHMAADVLRELLNLRDDFHGRYEADLLVLEAERYAAADRSVPGDRVANNLCTSVAFDWILR